MPAGPDAGRMASAAASHQGSAPTRAGRPEDAIDGVRPAVVVTPDTPAALAAVLREAAGGRQSVVMRGGGTKIGWGRPPGPIDVLVETGGLGRVIAHRHGDLTATFEPGAALRDVQSALASHRQWLPIDSAFDAATIGGLIATNDSGPLRHRHGTPRDLLIGITMATTDGRLVNAGGQVVKNVAGYDLGRLMSGSFGSLAAIVSATFKLAPLPPPATTLEWEFEQGRLLAAAVDRILTSQLEPLCMDVDVRHGAGPARHRLLLRFASTPRAVAHQCAEAARLLAPAAAAATDGEAEAAIWRAHVTRPWTQAGVVVRAAWPIAGLASLVERLAVDAARERACIELSGRAGVGAGLIRIEGGMDAQARVVGGLRSASAAPGAATVLRADPAFKARVDVWGTPSDSAPALQAIKRALDPAGILNAGRGPL